MATVAGHDLAGRRVLLVVSGGIAAYKALELIRLLTGQGCAVSCVLTAGGAQFVTPLSLQALTGEAVHGALFSLTEESEMGHIALSRSADLIVVCPASANILATMAAGLSHDLASTILLATDTPVLVAPAMNVRMWEHAATRANIALLRARGIHMVGPEEGVMACNEYGLGRLAEPPAILAAIAALLAPPGTHLPLAGRHALITAGPTHEPIDPVRYIANQSSGKQGYAIASALAALGARVTLVSGPVALLVPRALHRVTVRTADEMLAACRAALPADVAVLAAAVGDWRVETVSPSKLKKRPGGAAPSLGLLANPDILALLSRPGPLRPHLVVGFAAETQEVVAEARAKRQRKGCDWMLANDVSAASGIMGGDENEIHLITDDGVEHWPRLPKLAVAQRLAQRIASALPQSPTLEPHP
ncbi:bifunctional phosphopantothenoylcysteine decarboxylase/phosphopantothenate--cysteine ligase CoaBC [Lichenicoccus sp.]|uniref:bifunctional phosphopantothenoylcysteine decarboxylase/phosphopantothenate--cysteine ligase CoaBC n=1 Tax=Lichenicoccus sp. TaxID=2781899 RepID=UPI003D0B5958